jgi:DNA polymerase-3 subunit alpha
MGAIKGVGKGAVDTIIAHREQAPYQSIFDLVKRVDLRAANKKALENLVLAGGLDSFDDTHRAQYLNPDGEGISFLEKALRFGSKYQEQQQSSQTNLFGDQSDEVYQDLVIPQCESWNSLEMLKREKEVVGIYLSAHPLDDFKKEIKHFTSAQLDIIKDLEPLINRELHLAGIINSVEHLQTKNGKQWAKFNIEDFSDQQEFRIFSEDYLKFRHFLVANTFVRFRVAIREGWINHDTGKRGAPRLQFLTFESLQETIDKNSKKITLQLDIHNLNEETVSKIEEQLKTYRGDKHLAFDIYDPKEKIKLTLNSRKTKVNICPELLDYLDNQQWPYRLN